MTFNFQLQFQTQAQIRRFFSYPLAIALGSLLLGNIPPARAAEEVILNYPPFQRSVDIADLETFVETGETTTTLEQLFAATPLTARAFETALTREVNISATTLDRHLNSLPGKLILFQIGRTIRTPSGGANVQALRSALVLSASENERLSALEVLQNYPTDEVYVEARGLVRTFRQLDNFADDVRDEIEDIL